MKNLFSIGAGALCLFLFQAQAGVAVAPTSTIQPLIPVVSSWDAQGCYRSGPWLFAMDDAGRMYLMLSGKPMLSRMNLTLSLNGRYIDSGNFADRRVKRGPDGVSFSGLVSGTGVRFVARVGADAAGRLVFEFERHGSLPAGGKWNHLTLNLPQKDFPHDCFRVNGKAVTFPQECPKSSWLDGKVKKLEIRTQKSELITLESSRDFIIQDNRQWSSNGIPAYVVEFPFPEKDQDVRFSFTMATSFATNWQPEKPSVRLSRIGYSLSGEKLAVLEWSQGNSRPADEVALLDASGSEVLRGHFGKTMNFMGLAQAVFDFSAINRPGEYRLRWSGGEEGPFPVRAGVFRGLWKGTLHTFIPWQMCHASVKNLASDLPDRPPCHLDDAIRVPANFPGIDGFVSRRCEDLPWKAGEAIPCARGGWHDAGDYDLNISAQGFVTWTLALAAEEFKLKLDESSFDLAAGTFRAGKGDGVPDILQQVAWGAVWLLSMQLPDGRVAVGVIEQPGHYGSNVLPEKITDGKPGTGDERQLYPDWHPDVQLKASTSLAAASRVLQKHYPELSAKCLGGAVKAWQAFATRPEKYHPTVYFPYIGGSELKGRNDLVITALTELWFSTHEQKYLDELSRLRPVIADMKLDWPWPSYTDQYGFWFGGPALARLALHLPDGELRETCRAACRRILSGNVKERLSPRPYPFHDWDFGEWGISSTPLGRIFDLYWLSRALPGEVDLKMALPSAFWLTGLHPLNNYSMISGVGKEWTRYLYNGELFGYFGIDSPKNVTGAVIPGIASIPGCSVLFYADAPDDYRCNEACIYSAASWVFDAAALEREGF